VGLSLVIYSETKGYIETRFKKLLIKKAEGAKEEEPEERGGKDAELSPGTAFLEPICSEDNFIRSHGDLDLWLPSSACHPEYAPVSIQISVMPVRGGFWPITSHYKMVLAGSYAVFFGSLGIACLCSAFSSFLWMLVNYENSCTSSPQLFPIGLVMSGKGFLRSTMIILISPFFYWLGISALPRRDGESSCLTVTLSKGVFMILVTCVEVV
jgi:hypothetical protein